MEEPQNLLPGPVFEAGPGWGQKLGRWLKRNGLNKIIPTIFVLLLLAGVAKIYSHPKAKKEPLVGSSPTSQAQTNISVTVQKGDGVIAVSRRALSEYLKGFPDIILKPEEHLHIDNFFKTKYQNTNLVIGQSIEFSKTDLEKAVNEALQLSPTQRQQLRAYLK